MVALGPSPITDCKGIRGRFRKLIASRTQVTSTVCAMSYVSPIHDPQGEDVRRLIVVALIEMKKARTEEKKELDRKIAASGITGVRRRFEERWRRSGFFGRKYGHYDGTTLCIDVDDRCNGSQNNSPIPGIDDEKIEEIFHFLALSPMPVDCALHSAQFTSQQMMKILKFVQNFPSGLQRLAFVLDSFTVSDESKEIMYSIVEKILQTEDHFVTIYLVGPTDRPCDQEPETRTDFRLFFEGKAPGKSGIFSRLYQRYQKSLPKYDKLLRDIPKVEHSADNDFTDIVGSTSLRFYCSGKKNIEFPEIMRFLGNAKCKTMELDVRPFESLTWLLEKYIQDWKDGERSIDCLKFTFYCSSKRSTRTREQAALQQIAEDKGFKRHRLWRNKFDQEGPLEAYSFRFINGIRKLVYAFTTNPKRHCWVYLYTVEENDSLLPYPLGNKW